MDRRRIKKGDEVEQVIDYRGIVYSIALKRLVRIVYVQHKQTKWYEMLVCTDTSISAELIVRYYRLRFQIEFLLRDARQYCALEQCQARK